METRGGRTGIILLLFAFIMGLANVGSAQEKRLYKVEDAGKGSIKLVPLIHLVPPGSQVVHKGIELKEIERLPEGAKLKEKAMVDVKFFQELYEKENNVKLSLENAIFDIYKDFHDFYTDPVHFVFKAKKQ